MTDESTGRSADDASRLSPGKSEAPGGSHEQHDELADSHDLDELAGQYPPPPRRTPGAPADAPSGDGSPGDGSTGAGSTGDRSIRDGASEDGEDPAPAAFELPFPDAVHGDEAAAGAAASAAAEAEANSRAGRRRAKRAAKPQKPHRKAPWWELPALIGLAIVIAIAVKTFLVQPFFIPSGSMEKTLHGCTGCAGDRILVSKIIYDFRDPEPGDIVVFNAPNGWDYGEVRSTPPSNPVLRVVRGFGQLIGFVPPDGLVLVKRVIAVGGQTVKGDSAGHVFISDNGTKGPYRELHEGSYVYEIGGARAKFGPITVPKGRLWVMGDHRNDSADSRYHCGAAGQDGPDNSTCKVESATVPISNVIGKAVVIAWPPSRWRTLGTPTTFESASAGVAGSGLLPIGVVAPLFYVRRRRRRQR